MKSTFLLLQVLVGLSIVMKAVGQPLLPTNDFVNLAPERATQILNTTDGREQIDAYVRAAVSSQRTELIDACFENQYSWGATRSAIAALPESSQKDSLTILMLKSPSHFWPTEGLLDGSFPVVKPVMEEPFRSLVQRLLPNHPLDDGAISTRQKRLTLTTDLEMALRQSDSTPASVETEKSTIQPPKPVPLVQPPAPKKAAEARPTATTPSEEPASSTPWSIVVVLIVAATGLLWMLLKRRS